MQQRQGPPSRRWIDPRSVAPFAMHSVQLQVVTHFNNGMQEKEGIIPRIAVEGRIRSSHFLYRVIRASVRGPWADSEDMRRELGSE